MYNFLVARLNVEENLSQVMEFFIIISTNTLYSHLLAENVAQIIVSYVV
jgi:hypothetical protein